MKKFYCYFHKQMEEAEKVYQIWGLDDEQSEIPSDCVNVCEEGLDELLRNEVIFYCNFHDRYEADEIVPIYNTYEVVCKSAAEFLEQSGGYYFNILNKHFYKKDENTIKIKNDINYIQKEQMNKYCKYDKETGQ